MIASVVKAESGDLAHVIFALADAAVEDDLGLEQAPASLIELEKYELIPPLVAALQSDIGYPAHGEELKGEAPFNLGHFLFVYWRQAL